MKTCDKITHGSLALFNQFGERNMTTNHLAANLNISPGNLYYHFRNKEDIIRSIFDLYESHLDAGFQPFQPNQLSMDLLVSYFDTMFETVWKFRFMYNNLPDILSRDDELARRYQQTQKEALARSCAILRGLRDGGILAIEDEQIQPLADTMRMIACFWIDYKQTHTHKEPVTKAFLYEGLLRVIMLFKAHATQQHMTIFIRLELHYQALLNSYKTISVGDSAIAV